MNFIIFFFLTLPLFAQSELDHKLQEYVAHFNLKSLDRPLPTKPGLFKLGEKLFADHILSGNDNISCGSCHHPDAGTADGMPFGLGEGSNGIQTATTRRNQGQGTLLARSTPPLFNLSGVNTMFWDGRVSFDPITKTFATPAPLPPEVANTLTSALAAQALFPMVNHAEMRGKPGSNPIADANHESEAWELILKKVMSNPAYRDEFFRIYPGQKINIGHVAEAIAEFERLAFFNADTPYDSYLRGNLTAMTEIQKIGMDVFFNKGKCGECHTGEHLSNFEFHSVGTPQTGPGNNQGDDFGRQEHDPKAGLYSFRVPPLRNVAMTAPYMHDGVFKTLPQVIEHYDTVEASLTGFTLVNNWKNYLEQLKDHDHSLDHVRLASLSSKLTPKLGFQEEDEKALAEFLTGALTDKSFLAQELKEDYRTYMRLQLRPSGFKKLSQLFSGDTHREIYYYFDIFREGGFALRGLIYPIRLIIVKKPDQTELIFREMAHKTAVAKNGLVMDTNFNRQDNIPVAESLFAPMEEAYLDMFKRLYTYHDGTVNLPVPSAELSIMKSDLQIMNNQFHKINFDGMERVSDIMNTAKDDIYFVPTSFNVKDVTLFTLKVNGKIVAGNLQRSEIRTETGAITETFALELETSKVLKSDIQKFGQALIGELGDLKKEDIGGGTPSPSNLTIDVLKQVLK